MATLPDMRTRKNTDLLAKVRTRYKVMTNADEDNREWGMDDMRFVNIPGEQWDENMKQERGNRPCYEFNKLRIKGKRIINDMRANRPSVKVRPVEGGDKKVAEINEGLIRNIWNVSDADTVIDYAAEYQVNGGMAAWRVQTEYSNDLAFDQDICIKPILNPFCLYCDPACKDLLKRDANDWILTDRITHKAYEAKYPGAEKTDFDSSTYDDDVDWEDEETVRIAEYWYKEPVMKEIWLVPIEREGRMENQVVDSTSDEAEGIDQSQIVKRREVETNDIYWCIASGNRILEGPTKWAGRQFPFVMIFGEFVVIEGTIYWWGLPRFARDAQQSYNISRTAVTETIAQAPQAKWWATADQAKGMTDKWAEAHKKNYPFLLYRPDVKAPGPPTRMGGADIPVALIQEMQIADQELKDVTGIYDASLGERSNEQSGRAIYARQQQGEIATFNYQDNMTKGVRRTYEIVLDLIPEIYDTERELRVLGNDGAEDYVRVNQIVLNAEGNPVRVNDLSMGRYDVTITVGPSFATLRQEAAEIYGTLGQKFPALMEVAGDIIFKSMDLPYAEDISERLKKMLPPPLQDSLEGKDLPPEVQQAMQQVQMMMAEVEKYGQLVQAAAAELEQQKALTEKEQAELKTDLALVAKAKAEFDAHVAKELADLVQKEAGLTMRAGTIAGKVAEWKQQQFDAGDLEVDEVKYAELMEKVRAIDSVDGALAAFMQTVDNAMQSLEQKAERKVVGGKTRREGGKLVAEVEYSDGSKREIAAVRKKGHLELVPENPKGA